jgi:cytochrome c2
MDSPLAGPGDAGRGREVFVSREGGHCVLCHSAPGVAVAGNVGPPLAGVGARLTAARSAFASPTSRASIRMPRCRPSIARRAWTASADTFAGRPRSMRSRSRISWTWLGTLK